MAVLLVSRISKPFSGDCIVQPPGIEPQEGAMMTRASRLVLMAVSHLLFAAAAEAQGVSFMVRRDFGAGSSPWSVAVGDFNGDGTPDLAVANWGSANVSVLLGNRDGSFQAARNFGAGSRPQSVAVGDFNGDGVQDLAVANFGPCDDFCVGSSVSVLLGNGDGTFKAAQ